MGYLIPVSLLRWVKPLLQVESREGVMGDVIARSYLSTISHLA
jgi:hypothetical protein